MTKYQERKRIESVVQALVTFVRTHPDGVSNRRINNFLERIEPEERVRRAAWRRVDQRRLLELCQISGPTCGGPTCEDAQSTKPARDDARSAREHYRRLGELLIRGEVRDGS